jgi:hypothetical protein
VGESGSSKGYDLGLLYAFDKYHYRKHNSAAILCGIYSNMNDPDSEINQDIKVFPPGA